MTRAIPERLRDQELLPSRRCTLAVAASKSHLRGRFTLCAFLGLLLLIPLPACNKESKPIFDRPRLVPGVVLRDVTFHSASVNREMPYRVLMPAAIPSGTKLPVVYLLHGGGGNFRDWLNYSDVARFALQNLILVMPDGDESYYTNSREHPQDRYEDYIVNDLILDVETHFSVATGRANRAIAGLSMGGFGAVKLALKYPERFAFAGGLSSALDVPSRPFSMKRIGQWRQHASIFGPAGSTTRRDNDPLVLARNADPTKTPYLFLTCGDHEGLLATNQSFAKLLEERKFRYEFHVVPGAHNWGQWNARLDDLFLALKQHLGAEH
jgi:putative tributyrin esterase